MKDKRKYLLISGITEYLYIIGTIIYTFLTSKNSEEILATIFVNLFTFICATILIIYSTKNIEYLNKKRAQVVGCSIILFISSIISGIFGFMYLRQDGKKVDVPNVEMKNYTKIQRLLALILFVVFNIIMFILPKLNISSKIPGWSIYLFLFIITIAVSYKSLIKDAKDYFKNFRKYLPFVIKRYFLMLFFAFLAAIIVVLLTKSSISNNQQIVNEMLHKKPLLAVLLSVIYAPIIEESIFRLNLRKVIKNKTIFIIVSGLLFGLGHVINTSSSLLDAIPIIQYSTLGVCLAKAYSDTNNIMVSISMHFIQNALATILVLFVL